MDRWIGGYFIDFSSIESSEGGGRGGGGMYVQATAVSYLDD